MNQKTSGLLAGISAAAWATVRLFLWLVQGGRPTFLSVLFLLAWGGMAVAFFLERFRPGKLVAFSFYALLSFIDLCKGGGGLLFLYFLAAASLLALPFMETIRMKLPGAMAFIPLSLYATANLSNLITLIRYHALSFGTVLLDLSELAFFAFVGFFYLKVMSEMPGGLFRMGRSMSESFTTLGASFKMTDDAPTSPANGVVCPACGAISPNGSKFCYGCGAALPEKKVCPTCGRVVGDEDTFCTACGTKLS